MENNNICNVCKECIKKDNKIKCNRCLEIQDIEQFEISNKKTGLRRRQCKKCRKEINREYYLARKMREKVIIEE